MIAIYIMWCGFCWLLRGGKFGVIFRALFEREPGTDLGRFFAAFLMVAPLALIDPAYALLWVSLVGGMKLGYFKNSMGVKDAKEVAWMMLWGFTVLLVSLSPLAYFVGLSSLAYSALGTLAGPIYYANRLLGRRLGLDWTERSEILFGVAAGTAIALGTGAF